MTHLTIEHDQTGRCGFLGTLHPDGATAAMPLAREDATMADRGTTV